MVVFQLPEVAPPDLRDFRNWKPEAQQEALNLLRQYTEHAWKPFYCKDRHCNGRPHDNWEWEHARADQRPPGWEGDWRTWLLSGGRGSGKTRTGSEVTQRVTDRVPRIHLIAATGPDLRDTMVEGESGILATSAPGKRPLWEPSKKKLTWPNGCIGQGFSAEEPDRLRGPQCGFIWADEPAHWEYIEDTWKMALLGLRNRYSWTGELWKPKIVATTTPLPTKWLKALVSDKRTVVTRVSTYANLHNLAETFRDTILDNFEGTRMGRQELYGELLEDVEGSLWKNEMILHVKEAPELTRIVVGVDPAGTANAKSDETGIITCGVGVDKNFYILSDVSGRYSPERWARLANGEYDKHSADAIVPERNFGEDMVRFTLENAGYKGARLIPVRSRRGKQLRAEPVVALYEKAKVFHVGDGLNELEDEMVSWVPGHGPSPNRVDALVHAMTDLAAHAFPASFASPSQLGKRITNGLYRDR